VYGFEMVSSDPNAALDPSSAPHPPQWSVALAVNPGKNQAKIVMKKLGAVAGTDSSSSERPASPS
jgi:hypothetical protein